MMKRFSIGVAGVRDSGECMWYAASRVFRLIPASVISFKFGLLPIISHASSAIDASGTIGMTKSRQSRDAQSAEQ